MQAVGKPDVEVDRHRTVGDLSDGSFPYRQGMLDQGLKEAFIQPHTLLLEWELFRRVGIERKNCIPHERTICHDLSVLGPAKKGEPATADAPRLLAHDLVCLAADGNAH